MLVKVKNEISFQLQHIDRELYYKYREMFSKEIVIQEELCMLINQYMFDRIKSREGKIILDKKKEGKC